MELFNFEQGTDEWLEARFNKITGTKVHQLLSCFRSKALTPNFINNLQQQDYFESAATQRGKEIEQVVRVALEDETNQKLDPVTMVSKDRLCLASIDGWNRDAKRLIEIKSTKNAKMFAANKDELSTYWYDQCQFYLWASNKYLKAEKQEGAYHLDLYIVFVDKEASSIQKEEVLKKEYDADFASLKVIKGQPVLTTKLTLDPAWAKNFEAALTWLGEALEAFGVEAKEQLKAFEADPTNKEKVLKVFKIKQEIDRLDKEYKQLSGELKEQFETANIYIQDLDKVFTISKTNIRKLNRNKLNAVLKAKFGDEVCKEIIDKSIDPTSYQRLSFLNKPKS